MSRQSFVSSKELETHTITMHRLQDDFQVSSNRLKHQLAGLLHMDQTYCVPGCSVKDSLFLTRGMLGISTAFDYDLIIQEKDLIG